MEELQIIKSVYLFFKQDPVNFIFFGSLLLNLYLSREYIKLLKDNVVISKNINLILEKFDIDENKDTKQLTEEDSSGQKNGIATKKDNGESN